MSRTPGSEASYGSDSNRQYARDPYGVLSPPASERFEPNAALPDDAASTGFHRGGWQLWVAPSDSGRAVYLVQGDPGSGGVVERWPRNVDPVLCD